ncbi:MAG: hypothetical protein ACRCT8_05735 [Lacipirellulaceae bacterium]
MPSGCRWTIDGPRAVLSLDGFSAELDAAAPQGGLGAVTLGGVGTSGRLMRVAHGVFAEELIAPPSETYVRGDDYVSTHAATAAFPFRTQLYWSAEALGGAVIVTLTVSLQTDLLDTAPRVSLVSSIDGPLAVVGACHPTDAAETTSGPARLVFEPPFLEKGVIRRFRAAAVLTNGQEEGLVADALARFAAAPLPLTT